MRVNLAAPLDLRHDAGLLVDLDRRRVVQAPRPLSFARDGTATHSRDGDPVAASLAANLPGAFRVRQVISAAPAISLPSPVRPLYLPADFTPYRLAIDKAFPIPELPRDNPLIEERVALGREAFPRDRALARRLDFLRLLPPGERRASPTRGVSASAWAARPARATRWACESRLEDEFLLGRPGAVVARAGALPDPGSRRNGRTRSSGSAAKLSEDPAYPAMFRAAFGVGGNHGGKTRPGAGELPAHPHVASTRGSTARCAARQSFTAPERRGFELFMTEYDPRTGQHGADCFHCHGGPLFTDHQFHNNGFGAPGRIWGRFRVTASGSGSGQIRHAEPAQRRPPRALHARRPFRHARGGRGALRSRRDALPDARPEPGQASRRRIAAQRRRSTGARGVPRNIE